MRRFREPTSARIRYNCRVHKVSWDSRVGSSVMNSSRFLTGFALCGALVCVALGEDGREATVSSGPEVGKRMPRLPKVEEITPCHKNGVCISCFKRAG